MNERDELEKQAEEIARLDLLIEQAREALDIRGWAEANGIDLDRLRGLASSGHPVAALDEARREAEAQLNEVEQGLREAALASRGMAGTAPGAFALRTRQRV